MLQFMISKNSPTKRIKNYFFAGTVKNFAAISHNLKMRHTCRCEQSNNLMFLPDPKKDQSQRHILA